MDNGDRNPERDSAASSGRTAAIEAAFASVPDFDFSDDVDLSAGDPPVAETPAPDEKPDSASTEPVPASKAEGDEPKPEENARPVEEPKDPSVATTTLEAPKHWPADRRATFQALPDDAKKIVLERNKEANVAVTKAQQEAAQFRRTSEALTSVFDDNHRQQMQSSGLDEIGAIRYLIGQHDMLNKDPVGFLKAVIKQTGAKPEQLFEGYSPQAAPATQTPETEEWIDPAILEVRKQVAELAEWRNQQAQSAQQAEAAQAQRWQNWFTQECNKFENAIDDEGLPKYSHLPAVMDHVIRLVQTDPAMRSLLSSSPTQALEQAYNQAIYLNPEIRQSIIDADFERRMGERERVNSVQKAQAAVTRKGTPGSNGVAKVNLKLSRGEAIDKAFRDLGLN